MPNGEYVTDLAAQLREAEGQLSAEAQKVRKAHEETASVQHRLDAEIEAGRKLRDATRGYPQLVDALKAIAKSPKGAQKIAQLALVDAGIPLEASQT